MELYLCYAMCLEAAQLPSLILKNYRLVSRKSVFVPVTSVYFEGPRHPAPELPVFFFFRFLMEALQMIFIFCTKGFSK